jgi:hypothetical protein
VSSSGAPALPPSLKVERRAWQAAQVFIPAGSARWSRTANLAPADGNFHASFQRLFSDGKPLSSRPSYGALAFRAQSTWVDAGPWQDSQATLISLKVVL